MDGTCGCDGNQAHAGANYESQQAGSEQRHGCDGEGQVHQRKVRSSGSGEHLKTISCRREEQGGC